MRIKSTEKGKAQEERNSDHNAVGESKEVGGSSSKDDTESLLKGLECDEDDDFINDGNEEEEQERMVERTFFYLVVTLCDLGEYEIFFSFEW